MREFFFAQFFLNIIISYICVAKYQLIALYLINILRNKIDDDVYIYTHKLFKCAIILSTTELYTIYLFAYVIFFFCKNICQFLSPMRKKCITSIWWLVTHPLLYVLVVPAFILYTYIFSILNIW